MSICKANQHGKGNNEESHYNVELKSHVIPTVELDGFIITDQFVQVSKVR